MIILHPSSKQTQSLQSKHSFFPIHSFQPSFPIPSIVFSKYHTCTYTYLYPIKAVSVQIHWPVTMSDAAWASSPSTWGVIGPVQKGILIDLADLSGSLLDRRAGWGRTKNPMIEVEIEAIKTWNTDWLGGHGSPCLITVGWGPTEKPRIELWSWNLEYCRFCKNRGPHVKLDQNSRQDCFHWTLSWAGSTIPILSQRTFLLVLCIQYRASKCSI